MKKLLIASAALGALATAAIAQQAKSPKIEAVYWLSAETVSGMATGQPAGVEKNLLLQLGSNRANPAPSAAHLPPQALQAGERLPLVTPKAAEPKGDARPDYRPGMGERPKGKMEIYWGCGETVPAGQPFVVDFATLRPGSPSPIGATPSVTPMNPPASGRHATYGEWPNGRRGTKVPRGASLVGEHVVQGNYAPEMRFAVASGNDFLAPLAPRHGSLTSGAVNVTWPVLAHARGYILTVVAAREDGTTVMWTSSAVRMAGMALPDYLTQNDIARLVQQRILLSPDATQCVVPAAVAKASQSAMLMMTAYGPEGNYGSPREAPSGWAVKLRTKSSYMGVLGADMSGLMRGGDDDGDDASAEDAKPKKKRGLLRGVIGGALGIPG
jgi:opacity protein-like surface antigen